MRYYKKWHRKCQETINETLLARNLPISLICCTSIIYYALSTTYYKQNKVIFIGILLSKQGPHIGTFHDGITRSFKDLKSIAWRCHDNQKEKTRWSMTPCTNLFQVILMSEPQLILGNGFRSSKLQLFIQVLVTNQKRQFIRNQDTSVTGTYITLCLSWQI